MFDIWEDTILILWDGLELELWLRDSVVTVLVNKVEVLGHVLDVLDRSSNLASGGNVLSVGHWGFMFLLLLLVLLNQKSSLVRILIKSAEFGSILILFDHNSLWEQSLGINLGFIRHGSCALAAGTGCGWNKLTFALLNYLLLIFFRFKCRQNSWFSNVKCFPCFLNFCRFPG
jgi:hypothetical protein